MGYTKYWLCYLNELTFNGNLFPFIELLTISCAVFISYLMVINSKRSKSKYPNTIWWKNAMYYEWIKKQNNEWIMKKKSNKPWMLLNMA